MSINLVAQPTPTSGKEIQTSDWAQEMIIS